MAKVRVKLVKSVIGCPERQKATVRALGLHKTNSTVELEDTPQMMGMVKAIHHLVKVEAIS